ncbi:MAG: helix-turn-helix domain-containing protein [Patescibacteria group bacterium]
MEISSILSLIGITGSAQRIYLELLSSGPQSALFLSKKLSLPRASIYDGLHVLEKKSLVISQEENGKGIFSISDPKNILQILDSSAENIGKAKAEFSEALPAILKSPRITEPKIVMFSGKEGCQQTLRDILWYENTLTYTLWSMDKILKVITPEFLEWHNKKRVERGISLHSIRTAEDRASAAKYEFNGTGPEHLRELRFLPEGIELSMSYWIYGDNVAFVSSGSELYGFIVHSREFSQMMLAHFKLLWETAKK